MADLRRTFEPRYELRGLLGRGGMGVVIDAWDPVLERPLAIKLLNPEGMSDDPTARERLLREARAAATLSHPNVVSVFGVGETPELKAPYILMQRVMGETLERKEGAPPIDVPTAMRILGDVAEALTAAHARGLVHRDLKPSNVILDGQTGRAVVLDFGISAFSPTPGRQEVKLTATGMYVGTPLYMSPEQAMGEPATEKSDIYSLGCMMYELLAGKRVYDGDSAMAVMAAHIKDVPVPIGEVRPEVPPVLDRAVTGMLDKEAGRRPAADDLRRQFAPVPDAHPWNVPLLAQIRLQLRSVVILGIAVALELGYALYRVPHRDSMLGEIEGSLTVALIVFIALTILSYAVQSIRVALAVKRGGISWRMLSLLAGDGRNEVGRIADRLERFATVDPGVCATLLDRKRTFGSALLLCGPVAVVTLSTVALFRIGGMGDGSVELASVGLPVLGMLWAWRQVEALERSVFGRWGTMSRGRARDPFDRSVLGWLSRHAGPLGYSKAGIPRILSAAGLMVVFLPIVVVISLIATTLIVTAAFGRGVRPDLELFRLWHRARQPVLDLAQVVGTEVPADAGAKAWDSVEGLGVDTVRLGPSREWLDADPIPFLFPGTAEDSASRRDLLAAAVRGLNSAQRRFLESAASDPLVDALLTAGRTTSDPYLERAGLTALRQGDPNWAGARFPYWHRAVRDAHARAALLVSEGRDDSAKVVLASLLQVGTLRARRARSVWDWSRYSNVAIEAVRAMREIDLRRGRRSPWPDPPVEPRWNDRLGIPDTATPPEIAILDSALPMAVRWQQFEAVRYNSCRRPGVLWADEDPRFDSVIVTARNVLAVSATDSALIDGIAAFPEAWIAQFKDRAPAWHPARATIVLAKLSRRNLLAGCLAFTLWLR